MKKQDEVATIVAALQSTVMTLMDKVHSLELKNIELQKEVESLKSDGVVPSLSHRKQVKKLPEAYAKDLFWACTPPQHAYIQMVLARMSNAEIGKRLNKTEGTVKTSFRHLCTRLDIKGRVDLEDNYKEIFEDAADEYYLEHAKIPKDWVEKYGALSFTKAKQKGGDPYHQVINVQRHRGRSL